MERSISVKGGTAVLHPYPFDTTEKTVNHAANLKLLEIELSYCESRSKPKLIGISGKPGAGKTIFAKVIQANRERSQIIDVESICSNLENKQYSCDISDLLNEDNSRLVNLPKGMAPS